MRWSPRPLHASKETALRPRGSPTRRAAAGLALLFLAVAAARPAAAQITLGSPGEPNVIALGGGAFNVIGNINKKDSETVGLAMAEYRFGAEWWIISPLVGIFGNGQGSFYGYFGIRFDIHLPYNFILTPMGTFGYYNRGPNGFDLGSQWEFKTGAELAYRFADNRRFGVGIYHISNAGIGRTDPGQEQVTAVFTAPFP
jgi:lipid A 3-O-deacylase